MSSVSAPVFEVVFLSTVGIRDAGSVGSFCVRKNVERIAGTHSHGSQDASAGFVRYDSVSSHLMLLYDWVGFGFGRRTKTPL